MYLVCLEFLQNFADAPFERKSIRYFDSCFLRVSAGATVLLCLLVAGGCENFTPSPVEFDNEDVVAIGDVFTLDINGTLVTSLPDTAPAVDEKTAELGRLLFWDPVLSGDQDVACATCHLPSLGYTDGRPRSIGVGGSGRGPDRVRGDLAEVPRNSQSLINVVWNGINEAGMFDQQQAPMFWDNRATSLKEQAIDPLKSELEMRGLRFSEDEIIPLLLDRLNNNPEYLQLFADAYGVQKISESELADALAAFQSTLVANNAPYDRWMRGDSSAMSAPQISGMQEFVLAGCANCHSGPLFSDFKLHILGVPEAEGLPEPDTGDGQFAFRTPTLRQLEFTAPYFHGGQFAGLGSVMDFYDEPRGSSNPFVNTVDIDPDFLDLPETEFGLGRVIRDFLEALNDPVFDQLVPDSVPSGLVPGGR